MKKNSTYRLIGFILVVVCIIGAWYKSRPNSTHKISHTNTISLKRIPSQELSVADSVEVIKEKETVFIAEPIPEEWHEIQFNKTKYQIKEEFTAHLKSSLIPEELKKIKFEVGPYAVFEKESDVAGKMVVLREDGHHYGVITGTIQLMKIKPDVWSGIRDGYQNIKIVKEYPRLKSYLIRPNEDKELLKIYHELNEAYPGKVELEVLETAREAR